MTANTAITAGRPRLQAVTGIGDRAGPDIPAALDEVASEIFRVHLPDMMRFARKLTLDDIQRAEDIVQETMLRVWRHPEILRGGAESIRPWLFTVIKRVAIDLWRVSSRRGQQAIGPWPAQVADPADHTEQTITAVDIRAALDALSVGHRQVITEIYFHNRSADETAERLGIPVGTVKSRTYYALRALRGALRDHDYGTQPAAPSRSA